MKLRHSETNRRTLLKGAGAGVFLLALDFGERLQARTAPPAGAAVWEAGAFLRIADDGTIRFLAKHDEMGQGIHTGLALACAEELEVPLERFDVVPAPVGPDYGNSAYVLQVTGGSTSTWSSFDQMREAGAVARTMLIAAAAERWDMPIDACRAEGGVVRTQDDSRSATYAELASDAARQPVPSSVALKTAGEWRQIGKPTPRLDSPDKTRGKAIFSLDQRREGMLTASIERPPTYGGTVKSLDDLAARLV
ncbi:MAG: molybdopterin cofactor-binding domain-containing protein, partial [Planctomycetota bacterium]